MANIEDIMRDFVKTLENGDVEKGLSFLQMMRYGLLLRVY